MKCVLIVRLCVENTGEVHSLRNRQAAVKAIVSGTCITARPSFHSILCAGGGAVCVQTKIVWKSEDGLAYLNGTVKVM